jgi:sporulation protein YlmC with PRC-barrel domain
MTGPGRELVPCRELADEQVVDSDENNVGRLDQIVVDLATGRITGVILARGGVFGIGARFVAVPWANLVHDPTRGRFVISYAV